MNKSFLLLDKNNNLQKNANVIVKFSFNDRDYLIYSVDENESNKQIFVSKLILNSEGKYFVDNVSSEEKGKLNNIVYNIVILLPTEVQKGNTYESLENNLLSKDSVKLSLEIPELGTQEYFSNCSVAITSKLLVEAAVKLYEDNLKKEAKTAETTVPVWSSPEPVVPILESPQVQSSTPMDNIHPPIPNVPTLGVLESNNMPNNLNGVNSFSDPVVMQDLNLQSTNSIQQPENANNGSLNESLKNVGTNPQTEKLAIVSDPSLANIGVNVNGPATQPNVGATNMKKAGFANNKYIIIGTVCLLLAVTVVIVACILIKNMNA